MARSLFFSFFLGFSGQARAPLWPPGVGRATRARATYRAEALWVSCSTLPLCSPRGGPPSLRLLLSVWYHECTRKLPWAQQQLRAQPKATNHTIA